MGTVWAFVKRNIVALVSAIASITLEWWLMRSRSGPTVAQHQADRSLGALAQKSRDEQQAASDVPGAVWPTGDTESVISELKKAGIIK